MKWKEPLIVLIIAVAILLSFTIYVHSIPSERKIVVDVYRCECEASYDYVAYLKPNNLYGDHVGKNAILYTRLTDEIFVTTKYSLKCSKPQNISSVTIDNYLEGIADKAKWKKQLNNIIKVEDIAYNDSQVTVRLRYDLSSIYELIKRIENDTGIMLPQYSITTLVNYDVDGNEDVKKLTQALSINIIYGVGYTFERSGIIEITGKEGKDIVFEKPVIEIVKDNVVNGLKYALPLATASTIVLGLLTVYHIKKTEDVKQPEWVKLKKRFKAIDVESLPNMNTIPLLSPEDLEQLAKEYGLRVFHLLSENIHAFFISDGNLLYVYYCLDQGTSKN